MLDKVQRKIDQKIDNMQAPNFKIPSLAMVRLKSLITIVEMHTNKKTHIYHSLIIIPVIFSCISIVSMLGLGVTIILMAMIVALIVNRESKIRKANTQAENNMTSEENQTVKMITYKRRDVRKTKVSKSSNKKKD